MIHLQKQYNAPIVPEKAIRYLIHEGYTSPLKLLSVARIASGYICAQSPVVLVENFLETVYTENYHDAYDCVKAAYNDMQIAVPKYIHALYSCFPLWKLFMHLVYDSVSEFEMNLARFQVIPVLSEAIERLFPPELWKEFRHEPIYKR